MTNKKMPRRALAHPTRPQDLIDSTNQACRKSISYLLPACKEGKGMKLRCDLPWGGALEFETGRMSEETGGRIFAVCLALIGAGSFLGFFYMMT